MLKPHFLCYFAAEIKTLMAYNPIFWCYIIYRCFISLLCMLIIGVINLNNRADEVADEV